MSIDLLTCPRCGREFLCRANENCFMFRRRRCKCVKCCDNNLKDCEEILVAPEKVVFT